MKILASFLLVILSLSWAPAETVRPAPDFSWTASSGSSKSSREFRGRPFVVVFANSPRERAFRAQVGQLQKIYQRLAAQNIVCVAVFSQETGLVRSNIPFALVADGPRVAGAFDVPRGFGIAVVGRDGNLDYIGNRVLPAQRIADIIANSFVSQRSLRRQ